ncbi:MAG: hypothetical protein ABIR32_19745 [Ilumatobacteraceae bacterium]
MRRRNRVDPFGDLHAVSERGMFTGNRGCVVDDRGEVVRHHRGPLWISCLIEYRGWRSPLAAPNRWTPLFFLDDAVALAAGHRPCGLCRREAYLSYQQAVTEAEGSKCFISASDLNRRLASERLQRGSGIDRGADRTLWSAAIESLPTGAVYLDHGTARLVTENQTFAFSFAGWVDPQQRPTAVHVDVLTPPTSVAALAAGYVPVLDPAVRSKAHNVHP